MGNGRRPLAGREKVRVWMVEGAKAAGSDCYSGREVGPQACLAGVRVGWGPAPRGWSVGGLDPWTCVVYAGASGAGGELHERLRVGVVRD